MIETDKRIAPCSDQIIHDIDRMAELATSDDFNVELLEDHIIEISSVLNKVFTNS